MIGEHLKALNRNAVEGPKVLGLHMRELPARDGKAGIAASKRAAVVHDALRQMLRIHDALL